MENKILVYDDNCPLCSWYSNLFVKYGFINSEGRKSFSTLNEKILLKIDFDKSRNEIPLLDTSTNKVVYGIDALLEILGQKIPFIKVVGNFGPLKWLLKKFYKLVSYNRKVIVANKCGHGHIDCSPDTNYLYRFLFLSICLTFNTIMLYPLHNNIFSKLSYYHLSFFQLQIAHFVFVFINCVLAFSFSKPKGYEYIGQVNMLALSVILLLSPLIPIISLYNLEWLITACLILSAAFIFKEYGRRMEYVGVLSNNKWIVSVNILSLMGFILFLFH